MSSYKLFSKNSIFGIYLLIGSINVSNKIIKAANDIMNSNITFNKLIFFVLVSVDLSNLISLSFI